MMNANDYSTMMDLEAEVHRLAREIVLLQQRRDPLERKLRELQSLHYIHTLGITRDQCESPDGKGQWFGTVWTFAQWLSANSSKPWAIWNGRIYRTSDLIAGRMPESPALESSL